MATNIIKNGEFKQGFSYWFDVGAKPFVLDNEKARADSKEEERVRYFHSENVIYHSSGENESCLLMCIKRGVNDSTALLELKGAKLHQGYYTELVQHNHGLGTLDMDSQGDHGHGLGTLDMDSQGSHTHGIGTLDMDNQGIHSHGISGVTGSNGVTHRHDVGTLVIGSAGTHGHSITGTSQQTNISHSHNITAAGIEHNHSAGTQAMGLTSEVKNFTGSGTNAADQPHTHGVGTFAAASAGAHEHTLSGKTAFEGIDHTHAISLTSGNSGSHKHTLSGVTASAGSHKHNLSGSIASAGSHKHNLSGATANAGVTAKSYPDRLRVYINGVDKTSVILSRCSLGSLGDGTASHAFVTSGTNEMNVSDLISPSGMHEIKITEPYSGKGGRVLVHVEVL